MSDDFKQGYAAELRARERWLEIDRSEVGKLTAEVAYWRGICEVLKDIIAHQRPDDPAIEWLMTLSRLGAIRVGE